MEKGEGKEGLPHDASFHRTVRDWNLVEVEPKERQRMKILKMLYRLRLVRFTVYLQVQSLLVR